MILSIIIFIIVLALLVLVHEFGHFIVAKKSGMEVQEFGFGFPPRIFGIKKGETLYSVNLLPLGGFVKIVGENNEEESNPRSFINKPFWARFWTLVAGVSMNVVLAWVLISIGFMIGLPTLVTPESPLPKYARLESASTTVLQVEKDSPAAVAGLKEGDKIVSVDGRTFNTLDELTSYIKSNAGRDLAFDIRRGNEDVKTSIFSRPDPPPGKGAVGIALGNVGTVSFPWYIAPWMGLRGTWEVIVTTLVGFKGLIAGQIGLDQVGGPVQIAVYTDQVTKLGLPYLIQFAAFLSINLAVINILPFPALDGGRVLFLIIEKIRGKRNNQKVEQAFNAIGFALLMLLIILITFKDIRSLM